MFLFESRFDHIYMYIRKVYTRKTFKLIFLKRLQCLHFIDGSWSYKVLLSKTYAKLTLKIDCWKWWHIFQNIYNQIQYNNSTQKLPKFKSYNKKRCSFNYIIL